jgi:hypothetical protein
MQWPEFGWLRNRQVDAGPQIDMGNGRYLTAADLLEGHYRRLATQTVTVQLKPNLQAAITVLAPELAPLTEVASEMVEAMPRIQPANQFRQDLHRALELTHRQQQAQRVLGTRTPVESGDLPWTLLLVLTSLVAVLALALFYRQRQTKPSSA